MCAALACEPCNCCDLCQLCRRALPVKPGRAACSSGMGSSILVSCPQLKGLILTSASLALSFRRAPPTPFTLAFTPADDQLHYHPWLSWLLAWILHPHSSPPLNQCIPELYQVLTAAPSCHCEELPLALVWPQHIAWHLLGVSLGWKSTGRRSRKV